jgi:hypothetical protein
MNFLRKLALVWMIAWLPVSGVMAATMPFCAQGMMGMMQSLESGATSSDKGMPPHCAEMQSDETAPACEHCDLCHIAGAIVPPTLLETGNRLPSAPPSTLFPADFSSFFPDLLPRPPALTQA